jgi:hypothetical protein
MKRFKASFERNQAIEKMKNEIKDGCWFKFKKIIKCKKPASEKCRRHWGVIQLVVKD